MHELIQTRVLQLTEIEQPLGDQLVHHNNIVRQINLTERNGGFGTTAVIAPQYCDGLFGKPLSFCVQNAPIDLRMRSVDDPRNEFGSPHTKAVHGIVELVRAFEIAIASDQTTLFAHPTGFLQGCNTDYIFTMFDANSPAATTLDTHPYEPGYRSKLTGGVH